MVVAIKYNEDSYFSMIFYAKIGGVSKTEMIYLEFYFVTLIKFNLFVKNELFNKYNDYISSKDDEEESEEPYEDENSGEISDSNNINDNENNSNNNNNNGKY
jgi:1,4-dihydroxy-2-naphthoate octaprenyltransferase